MKKKSFLFTLGCILMILFLCRFFDGMIRYLLSLDTELTYFKTMGAGFDNEVHVLAYMSLILIMVLNEKIKGKDFTEKWRKLSRKPELKRAIGAFAVGVGICLASMAIQTIPAKYLAIEAKLISPWHILLLIFTTPFFTTLVFRVIIQDTVQKEFGMWTGIITGAVVFVLFSNIHDLATACLGGLVYGIIFAYSRNIYYPMIAHFSTLTSVYLFTPWINRFITRNLRTDLGITTNGVVLTIFVCGMALLVCGTILVCYRKNRMQENAGEMVKKVM